MKFKNYGMAQTGKEAKSNLTWTLMDEYNSSSQK